MAKKWSRVFEGETHRVRFRTLAPDKKPRTFVVESLANKYNSATAFSRGDLLYFDIDLEMAWDCVRRVAAVTWPTDWANLSKQHPVDNRIMIRETPQLEFPERLLCVYSWVDDKGMVTYNKKDHKKWALTATGCGVSVQGDKENLLAELCSTLDKLYDEYSKRDWKHGITSPIGGGFAAAEVRTLKPMRNK